MNEETPVLNVRNSTVRRVLLNDPFRHATLEEYARASGLEVDVVMEELEHALDSRALALETAHGEVFVLTAPEGRPLPDGVPWVAPNLWEVLRYQRGVDAAHHLWQVHRGLERAGWEVVSTPQQINGACNAPVAHQAPLGVLVGGLSIPVIVHPSPEMVADTSGPLGDYERAGARAVGIVCGLSGLDAMATAVRRFALGWRLVDQPLTVIVLEAPRYQPVVLQAHDTAVSPLSVSRSDLQTLVWGPEIR
jgi:hypothetical protein